MDEKIHRWYLVCRLDQEKNEDNHKGNLVLERDCRLEDEEGKVKLNGVRYALTLAKLVRI